MLRNILLVTIPFFLVLFCVLELTFIYVIPASEFPYYYYDPDDRVLKYSTTAKRDGLFTIGSLAQQRAKWRINNAGWNSSIDFVQEKRNIRIAIIGDSYVEAFQVDVGDSIAGQLRRLLSPGIDVYAFGISGAPLSQYLQMARYVRDRFDPDILVINVVHNDFDESLCSTKRQAGMLCLEDDGTSIRESSIFPYEPNSLLRLLRRSSSIRFAMANLRMGARWERLKSGMSAHPTYNANIDVQKTQALHDRIEQATEYILGALKREYKETPILFLIDAPRKDLYAHTLSESNVRWLNELLMHQAARFGFLFVDLTNEFGKVFHTEQVHLESEYDWHWNEAGHRAAAQAVFQALRANHLAH